MKKLLMTAGGPNMERLLRHSVPTFRRFAETHDYDLVVERDINDAPDRKDPLFRAAQWAKVGLFEKYLPLYDLVVWMDADVMITKFDKDIADDFNQDCFQAFVLEQFPTRFNPNSGVWAMRQGGESLAFLKAVRSIGQIDHIWTDQAAICIALGREVYKNPDISDPAGHVKLVNPSEYLKRTSWLAPEWNPLGLAAKWPSRLQHFAGLSNEERILKMKALSQKSS
ncbi:MAG TPA: hypothetical protein VH234_03380 [Candidatus Saccharimonadales bacterium]|jgi:hypothetical protein|nr:hypothetical protein [Candidatus Saccharimonadales bacterium]